MELNAIKEVILDQRVQLDSISKREKIIKRERISLDKYLVHPNILVIFGIRRCGKSTLSMELFEGQKFGYINFDDDRLVKLKTSDLNTVLQAFYEIYGNDLENIILDEIQEVYGWEKFAARLRIDKKVIVTGSNSKLLSGELATSLTGRHIDFTLFPFSFKEYLNYKGLVSSDTMTTKEKASLNVALGEYLKEGGFPERFVFGSPIIKQIYGDIIMKDIIKRHKIKNETDLRSVAAFLMANITKEFSYSSIQKLTNVKHPITISKWIKYLEEVYLFFGLNRFSFQLKEAIFSPKKIYSVDNGLSTYISPSLSDRNGILMENAVAIELFRRKSLFTYTDPFEIFYWKDHHQREVDFVIKRGNKISQLIQVTYATNKNSINEREAKNLITASDILSCRNLLVITWDYEAEEKIKGKKIKFIPLWKWLLDLK
jgi:hypothetical protein